jgi:hypothetical protein
MNLDVLERLPLTAHNHFLLHFYAAVARVLAYVDRRAADGAQDRRPSDSSRDVFLAGYRDELAQLGTDGDVSWWEHLVTVWEGRESGHLPLRAIAEAAGLDFRCRITLLALSLAEVDSRFGSLFAELQAPLGHRRPTLETLGHLLAEDGRDDGLQAWEVGQRLVRAGLAEVVDPEAPRSEWQLRIPAVLWDLVQGRDGGRPQPWCTIRPLDEYLPIEDLPLPAMLRDQLAQLPGTMVAGQISGLVLRGAQGSDRLGIVGSVAAAMGMGVAEIDLPLTSADPEAPTLARHLPAIGPLSVMARCLPVVTLDLGPGETADLPALVGQERGLAVLLGHEGGVRGDFAEHAMTLTVPMPTRSEREQVWRSALAGVEVDDLDGLVGRYHLPTGYIRQAAPLAVAHAALDGRSIVATDDVAAAVRSLNRQQLDTLAARIEARGDWTDLVVNDGTAAKLRELELRCHHREQLLEHLGPAFGATTNRGVRALFSGASGTGKTLAANILASALGVDLYRVDLSAVVNKYIGETEKNLNRVLSRAEELDVVLLLDEGDSLLGNRTDVKSANDRYANLETNYLLQRLEGYQGVVVVTTNANQLIDRAFQRRIDIVVNFVPPGPVERASIWSLHLPSDHQVSAEFLADVAQRCVLTGGQIRNAALAATLLAVDADRPISDELLFLAIESEYRKAGALCPLRDDGETRAYHGGVESFVATIQRAPPGGAITR